jgi:hypothetical protein
MVKIKTVSELLEKDIHGLIGMDIMKNYDLKLTKTQVVFYPKKTLEFSNDIKMNTLMTIPLINIEIKKKIYSFFLILVHLLTMLMMKW